ncbi:tetratricopeptide repeat protein [Halobacteriovorax sp. HLS]|uniref:YfgM family protein n=1 Tax=Halobacteriovorax sp. HLS TaxID=2234000 RepID=UPI000FD9410A|nr:tetratricopeptide repeat protein [Halobacteriovorax sp. HLS]
MSTSPTAHNPVDEILKETELGTFIANYKTPIIAFVIAVIVGVFAWGGYSSFKSSKNDELGAIVYNFKKANLQSLVEKKITTTEFEKSFSAMASGVANFEGLTPFAIQASDELVAQNDLNSALAVLKTVTFNKNPYAVYFVRSRMAVIHEDLGQNDKAIEDLELIVKNNIKTMESKTYLDLGRLYVKKGDQAKAKSNFQYVIDNVGQAEFVKLAKLYMSEME